MNSEAIDRKKKVGTAHVDNVEDAISAINLKHMPVYVLQASVTMREVVKGMSIYLWSDGGQPEHRPYLGMVGTIVRVDEVKGGSSKTGNSRYTLIFSREANKEAVPSDPNAATNKLFDKPVGNFSRPQFAWGFGYAVEHLPYAAVKAKLLKGVPELQGADIRLTATNWIATESRAVVRRPRPSPIPPSPPSRPAPTTPHPSPSHSTFCRLRSISSALTVSARPTKSRNAWAALTNGSRRTSRPSSSTSSTPGSGRRRR